MKNEDTLDKHFTHEHEATCSICSRPMTDLMTFIVYWILPLWRAVDEDENGYAYQSKKAYSMTDIRRRRYHICANCYGKAHNKKMIFMLFGVMIAAITPALFLIEQVIGFSVLIGFDANIENFFLGLIIGAMVVAFNFPVKKVILDNLARAQLKTDLVNGKFQHSLSQAEANEVKSWTELVPHNDPTLHHHHHHTGRHKEA